MLLANIEHLPATVKQIFCCANNFRVLKWLIDASGIKIKIEVGLDSSSLLYEML
jgi:hypothetical protein